MCTSTVYLYKEKANCHSPKIRPLFLSLVLLLTNSVTPSPLLKKNLKIKNWIIDHTVLKRGLCSA